MPPFLYKYRALGPRTEEIITTGRIWLAKPSTLNDPLDCAISPIGEKRARKLVRAIKGDELLRLTFAGVLAQSRGMAFLGLRGWDRDLLINRLAANSDVDIRHAEVDCYLRASGSPGLGNFVIDRKYIEEQISNVGVFSLSADPASTLMWSHYASNHAGIALGFGVEPKCELLLSNNCEPIKYTNKLTKFRFGFDVDVRWGSASDGALSRAIPITEPAIRRALFSKTKQWAYEKEWRYIVQDFGLYEIPAPIRRVVFGVNCPTEERRRLQGLVRSYLGESIEFQECYFESGATMLKIRSYV